jgi:hypothetical protein
MTLFSPKSIGLYSLAIGSAIVFFNIVTSYGEANLKAPISITGNYLITSQNLPDCLQQPQLMIEIQQSGMYLNASLANDRQQNSSSENTRPTLAGKLRDRQLDLIGLVPTAICPQGLQLQVFGSLVKTPATAVKGQIKTDLDRRLQGQLWSIDRNNQKSRSIEFTGALQPSTRSTPAH